jgi:hypothetical protein
MNAVYAKHGRQALLILFLFSTIFIADISSKDDVDVTFTIAAIAK